MASPRRTEAGERAAPEVAVDEHVIVLLGHQRLLRAVVVEHPRIAVEQPNRLAPAPPEGKRRQVDPARHDRQLRRRPEGLPVDRRPDHYDELISQLRQSLGLTVLMVTNDLDSLHAVCDRIAVLLDKRVVVGTMEEMLAYDHPWVREYFHGPRGRAALKQQA